MAREEIENQQARAGGRALLRDPYSAIWLCAVTKDESAIHAIFQVGCGLVDIVVVFKHFYSL